MKKCPNCGLEVLNERVTCPFCRQTLEEFTPSSFQPLHAPYPKYWEEIKKKNYHVRVLLLISFFIGAIALIFNLMTWNFFPHLWCLLVMEAEVDAWLIIWGLIINKINFFRNLVATVFVLIGLSYTVQFFFPYSLATDYTLFIVAPSLIGCAIIFIGIWSCYFRKYYQNSVIYLLLLISVGLAYAIVFLCIRQYMPSDWYSLAPYILGILSLSVLLAMFFLAPKQTISQIKRLFII
jgi:rRNA maturation protein Nop10